MRRSTPAFAVALTVSAALVLAACGSGSSDTSTSAGTQTTPAAGNLDTAATIDVRQSLEPTSLDIFSTAGAALDQLLLDNVYQGLLRVDTNAHDAIVPELAKGFDVSDDGLTYTFHLVDGATFHDGSPLTAADVVWSLKQVTAPGSKSTVAAAFAAVTDVTAPDPQTVVITLKQRDTDLTWQLAQRGGIVFKSGTDLTKLAGAENGSGPFKLGSWKHGSAITLVRDDAYWGDKAKAAKVVFHYIPDQNAAVNAERTGQTQVAVAVDPSLLSQFEGNSGFEVLKGKTTDKFVLAFNQRSGPLANADVRHAIRQAIDKKGFLQAVYDGEGTVIGSDVPPTDPWYEDLTSIDAYDPASAKALLKKAGYGDGLKLTLKVANFYPTTIGDYVAAQLKQVGITVKVQPVEFQTWLTDVFTNHDYELSIVDHAEARDIANYANPKYYFGYDNKQVQAWYGESLTAKSDAERDAALKKVARQISQDAATDWLGNSTAITVVKKGVTGVPVNETSSRYDVSDLAEEKAAA